jgi:hypothetical protein
LAICRIGEDLFSRVVLFGKKKRLVSTSRGEGANLRFERENVRGIRGKALPMPQQNKNTTVQAKD